MMAEGIYRQAIEDSRNEKTFNRVYRLKLFANLLMKNRMRESEAKIFLNDAEQLEHQLKPWHEKIDLIYIPDFDLQ